MKKRLNEIRGKPYFKGLLVRLFRIQPDLFKDFLTNHYDFDAWSIVYDTIIQKNALKDEDFNIMKTKSMHDLYIDYIRDL